MRAALALALGLLAAAPAAAQPRAAPVPPSEEVTESPATDPTVPATRPASAFPGAGGEPTWAVEQARLRIGVFDQEGRGYQSRATSDFRERGDEDIWVWQPILYFRFRQGENITHDVTLPVDIVTAASTDALDAVSTASRLNEAFTGNVITTVQDGPDTAWQWRWGGHFEEHYWTGSLGGAYLRQLADDNAQLQISADLIVDTFDGIDHNGVNQGFQHRVTASANAGISQLLSPTTIVFGSYGFTAQWGTLETPWNSVPRRAGGRVGDRWPGERFRHAFRGELRQLIPATQTGLAANYRFYFDDFSVTAHTVEGVLTQSLGDLLLRAAYRFHTQGAPSFWTSSFDGNHSNPGFRTADSDLEALDAHELRLSLRWFYARQGALTAASPFFQIGHVWYWRSNDLSVNLLSLDWGHAF